MGIFERTLHIQITLIHEKLEVNIWHTTEVTDNMICQALYVQTIMANIMNNFYNLLINMHSPVAAFLSEQCVLEQLVSSTDIS